MFRSRLAVLMLVVATAVSGCAAREHIPPDQGVVLHSYNVVNDNERLNVRVAWLDGAQASLKCPLFKRCHAQARAGERTVGIFVQQQRRGRDIPRTDVYRRAAVEFLMDLKANREYVVKAESHGRFVNIWIEDEGNAQRVSEIARTEYVQVKGYTIPIPIIL